ncbi:hypothetical protein [Lacticaseibacillus yichunensis]|uniref:Uncharacterized protein n=1 Tax=Lacticaseibacillus yichunensis TaxID=2486015 RepID=A0ABW4CS88_9LACO|nr:hypothetical protein [Lacticaseibacillus yichunensis]
MTSRLLFHIPTGKMVYFVYQGEWGDKMRYAVVGAMFQDVSLTVFHSGLDDEPLDFEKAIRQALSQVIAGLAASPLADLHALTDEVMQVLMAKQADLHALDDETGDNLTVNWLADDHFIISVMDETEQFQLSVAVTPIIESTD